MEIECERVKEWGNGRILQVREEGVDGCEREKTLGLEHVCLLNAFVSRSWSHTRACSTEGKFFVQNLSHARAQNRALERVPFKFTFEIQFPLYQRTLEHGVVRSSLGSYARACQLKTYSLY